MFSVKIKSNEYSQISEIRIFLVRISIKYTLKETDKNIKMESLCRTPVWIDLRLEVCYDSKLMAVAPPN